MGTVVGTVTVLTVGVVKGDAVDFDAVVTVVSSGVVAVVCDSVANVVGLTVLSITQFGWACVIVSFVFTPPHLPLLS